MKISRLLLTSTTALGLSMTAAVADDNEALLNQDGAGNTASIDQTVGVKNRAGRPGQPMTQDGDDNAITLIQRNDGSAGNQNNFGRTNVAAGEVTQTGSRNVLDAIQDGRRNQTATVLQTAPDGLAGTSNSATIRQMSNFGGIGTVDQSSAVASPSLMNTLTLEQLSGNSNKIGTAEQEFTGAPGAAANEMTITQAGPTNKVNTASQSGFDNNATVLQTGGRTNMLDVLQQVGSENDATVTITGNFNGVNGSSLWDALPLTDDFSGASGATESQVLQNGIGNSTDLGLTGDRNAYGVSQQGEGNLALGIMVTGNDNSVGVGQFGDFNDIFLSTVTGDRNSTGFNQTGDGNFAETDVLGDDNDSLAMQTGDANESFIFVSGDGNTTNVAQDVGFNFGIADVLGDGGNVTLIDQTGQLNQGGVGINGAGNNVTTVMQGGLSNIGEAFVQGGGFNTTLVDQTGTQNDGVVDVSGGGNNVTTLTQDGFRNVATARVTGAGSNTLDASMTGDFNRLQLAQDGGGNLMDVSVTGNRNNATSLPAFSGDALAANTMALDKGDLFQRGDDNDLLLDVDGDQNRFAMLQQGSTNSIDGTISGNGNQAVVAQLGNGSSTTFTQTGSFNNLGVSQ